MARPGVTGLFCALDLNHLLPRTKLREDGRVLHSQAGAGPDRCGSAFTGVLRDGHTAYSKFFIPDGNRRLSRRNEAWPETRIKSRAGGTQ